MSILTVEHLTHGFGDRAIFSDVSFRLLRGEHIGLVGANGEGKSTFFNMITGHLTPDEGKIEWAKHVRAGYLDQHTVLEKGMTIRDVLKSAFSWLFDLEEQMNQICDRLGSVSEEEMTSMMEELGTIQDMLSGGSRKSTWSSGYRPGAGRNRFKRRPADQDSAWKASAGETGHPFAGRADQLPG